MEPVNYTTPSSESSAIHDRALAETEELVFPDWSDPGPLPPPVPVEVMLRQIAAARTVFCHALPTPDERWAAKPLEEFIL